MEVAKLVLEYLRVVAWPSIAIWALWILRPHMAEIIRRLRAASIPGGVSIDLTSEIESAQAISRILPNAVAPPDKIDVPRIPLNEMNARMISLGLDPSPSGLDIGFYRRLADQDPNVALAGIRIELELQGRNLARGFNIELPHQISVAAIFRQLQDKGAITADQNSLAQKVIRVCDAAIHGMGVSIEDANAIVDVVDTLRQQYISWLSWGFEGDWQPNNT